MKRYIKPNLEIIELFDIITASGEDIVKGIANPEVSSSVDFSDAILDPATNPADRLGNLFPAN